MFVYQQLKASARWHRPSMFDGYPYYAEAEQVQKYTPLNVY